LEPLGARQPTMGLGKCTGGVPAQGSVGKTWRRLVAFFLEDFFRELPTLSYEKVQLRIPIAHNTSHTKCLSVVHLAEAEAAVSAVQGAGLLPVEVCSIGAEALQEL